MVKTDLLLKTEIDFLLPLNLMLFILLLLQNKGLLLDVMSILILLSFDQLLDHVLELDQLETVFGLEGDLLLEVLTIFL